MTLSCVYSGMIGMSSARELWSVHGGGRARDRPQPRTGAPPFFAPISALQRVLLCASDIGKDHKGEDAREAFSREGPKVVIWRLGSMHINMVHCWVFSRGFRLVSETYVEKPLQISTSGSIPVVSQVTFSFVNVSHFRIVTLNRGLLAYLW